jgi:hypothetical protein
LPSQWPIESPLTPASYSSAGMCLSRLR